MLTAFPAMSFIKFVATGTFVLLFCTASILVACLNAGEIPESPFPGQTAPAIETGPPTDCPVIDTTPLREPETYTVGLRDSATATATMQCVAGTCYVQAPDPMLRETRTVRVMGTPVMQDSYGCSGSSARGSLSTGSRAAGRIGILGRIRNRIGCR